MVWPAARARWPASLDGGAVGHGIGEGHAELDQVDARAGQAADDLERPLAVGIARHDEGDESGAVLGAQRREAIVDAGHSPSPTLPARGGGASCSRGALTPSAGSAQGEPSGCAGASRPCGRTSSRAACRPSRSCAAGHPRSPPRSPPPLATAAIGLAAALAVTAIGLAARPVAAAVRAAGARRVLAVLPLVQQGRAEAVAADHALVAPDGLHRLVAGIVCRDLLDAPSASSRISAPPGRPH